MKDMPQNGERPALPGGSMLRSQVSKRSLHSSCRMTAGNGRNNFHRALTAGALFFCCWIMMVGVTAAYAQEAGGAITGAVVDPNGIPVQGAAVTARDVERGTVLTTQSNETGAFNFTNVP